VETELLLLLMFVASVAGGGVPLLLRDTDRLLHVSLSLAAGFFLGVVFLHLLPELSAQRGGIGGTELWAWALAGLLVLLVLDLGVFGHGGHAAMGWATLIGLTIHAAAAGIGFGVYWQGPVSMVLVWALLSHKFGETFSLMSAMRFSLTSRVKLLAVLVVFSTITPLSMFLGLSLRETVGSRVGSMLSALAVGTFLYVAVGELLPEVFHENRDRLLKVSMLILGVMFAALSSGSDAHGGSAAESTQEATWLAQWVEEFLGFFVASAPFLLIGFFVAGLIRVVLPQRLLTRLMGKNDVRSVMTASAIGVPLPLCSCSVLPTALSLRKSGASKGATVSFLVSTPETGVDSIAVTYALLDPTMTVARPIAALVSATAAGLATTVLDRDEPGAEVESSDLDGAPDSCCDDDDARPKRQGLKDALRYAFVDLVDDILPVLLIGFAVSALLQVFLPGDLLGGATGGLGYLMALVIGVPVYICATASTPVAAALIAKGLSPGAALVFLLVGPATNLGSIIVLVRALGKRAVTVYLTVVVIVSVLFGIALDAFYTSTGSGSAEIVSDHGLQSHSAFETVAGLVLASLVVSSLLRLPLIQRRADVVPGSDQHDHTTDHCAS